MAGYSERELIISDHEQGTASSSDRVLSFVTARTETSKTESETEDWMSACDDESPNDKRVVDLDSKESSQINSKVNLTTSTEPNRKTNIASGGRDIVNVPSQREHSHKSGSESNTEKILDDSRSIRANDDSIKTFGAVKKSKIKIIADINVTDSRIRILQRNTSKDSIVDQLISDEEDDVETSNVKQNVEPSVIIDARPLPKESVIKTVHSFSRFELLNDDKSVNDNWWENFKKYNSNDGGCNRDKCTFAPHPHAVHKFNERSYSTFENTLIIQYLIHYDVIQYGKGLQVWEDLHMLGYLKHRSVQSLSNHFKKYLLRDIKSFNLPKTIEDKFLALQVSQKIY